MNNLCLKVSALALAVSTVFLVACGGGSSDSSISTSPTVTGLAIDGPVAGAIVTFKDCGNQTTITATDGTFTFPAGCSQSEIIITGGIDTTTGLNFTGELKAPAVAPTNGQNNQVIVSPITTLINYANGDTSAIVAALNLPAGTDPLKIDPLTNKELLIKTFVVQQLIEEIQETLIFMGVDSSIAVTLATKTVTETLLDRGTSALTNQDFIQTLVVRAIESSAPHLSTELQSNLENVKTNVAALTTQVIARNVAKVQTALEAVDLSNINDAIEVIKNFTQQEVVASKESVTTTQLIQVFFEIIPQPLTSESLTALNLISSEFASGTPDSTNIQNALAVLPATAITVEDIIAASFYKDYFKLDRFSLNNQNYSSAELNHSLVTPIATRMTRFADLTNFTLTLNAFGNLVNTQQQFSATLRIRANDKKVLVHINNISADFNSAGYLTAAQIPKGAQISLTSNLQSLTYNNTVTIPDTMDALVENGQLTFNSAMLSALSPSLESTLNSYSLGQGTIVTIEAIISKNNNVIAVNDANDQPQSAKPLTLESYAGRGVNAKFQITP